MTTVASSLAALSPAATTDVQRLGTAMRRKQRLLAGLDRTPFRPAWWLPNGHLQTILPAFYRRSPRLELRCEEMPTADDDFVMLHRGDGAAGAPLVLILHGLESSARGLHVRSLASRVLALGWNCAAMEFRTCSPRMNLARRTYHAGETSDLDMVVRRLREEHPRRRMYAVGFSLGGNILAKWLGELESAAPIDGAALICPPFDLAVSTPYTDAALRGLYARYFVRTLRAKVAEKLRQYPGAVDEQAVQRARTIMEFDSAATAPLHGFESVDEYYRASSCRPYLSRIRVTSLVLVAEDDFFIPSETIPREELERSAFLVPQITRGGGHVGFMHGMTPGRADCWAETQTVSFLRLLDRNE